MSAEPSTCRVTDHLPGGRSANEYTPSLPDSVARMAPSPALTAVTVACSTGSLAESVTIPTMVPGKESAAGATDTSDADTRAHARNRCGQFRIFIGPLPFRTLAEPATCKLRRLLLRETRPNGVKK